LTLSEQDEQSPRDFVVGIYLANRASNPTITAPTLCIVPLRIRRQASNKDKSLLFTTAKQIQADLEKISAQEVVGTGLWEIEEWTGVRVDCFVNFLMDFSNLDDEDSDRTAEASQRRVHIEPEKRTEEKKKNNIADNVVKKNPTFQDPETLRANTVRASYTPSIDIEAAVRNDALDLGIFGPTRLVSNEAAGNFISEMCRLLEALVTTDTHAQPQTADFEDAREGSGGCDDIEGEYEEADNLCREGAPGGTSEMKEEGDDEDYEEVVHEMIEPLPGLRRSRAIWPRPLSVLFGGWRC